jgi:hypothetical protein
LRALCFCFGCGKNQTTNQLPWIDEVNVDVMLAGEYNLQVADECLWTCMWLSVLFKLLLSIVWVCDFCVL